MTRALALMGGGFLLAVLWFDLKFDILALEALRTGGAVSEDALSIIRTYYKQALATESGGFPLIISMMAIANLGALLQLRDQAVSLWVRVLAMGLVFPPVSLAGIRVVPNARVLGEGQISLAEQSDLAILILQDHLYCIVSICAFLALQLTLTWKAHR